MPSMYISHYETRMPPQVTKHDYCQCGKKKNAAEDLCTFCMECVTDLDCF